MTSTSTGERSRTIRASPGDIRPLLTNVRNWRLWSPFKSLTTTTFVLTPQGDDRTDVLWRTVGPRPLGMRVPGTLLDPERIVGTDFAKGLTALDEAARTGPSVRYDDDAGEQES